MNDLIEQAERIIQLSPPALVTIALIGIGWVIRQSAIANQFIPLILLVLGAVIYPMVAEVGKVSYHVTYPLALNALIGACLGLGAVGANQLYRQLLDRKSRQPKVDTVVKEEGGKTTVVTEITPAPPIEETQKK